MATASTVCGICEHQDITNSAVVWCSECDEAYCDDCLKHHNLVKATRQHSTTPITQYQALPSFVRDIQKLCSKHNQKFQTFCKDHNCPCCRICTLEKHKQCQNLAKLEDVVQGVKTSFALSEIEKTLAEVSENLQRFHEVRQKNLTSLSQQKTKIEREIELMREEINTHLDNLKDSAVKKLNEVEERERIKIEEQLTSMDTKGKEIEHLESSLVGIKEHASDLQAYLAMLQLSSEVDKQEQWLQTLCKDRNVTGTVITMDLNKSLSSLLTNVKSFGTIITTDKRSEVCVVRRKKHEQAQINVNPQPRAVSIQDIKVNLQKTFSIDSPNSIATIGCSFLSNGKMAFCAGGNISRNLYVVRANGEKDFIRKLSDFAFDICFIEEDSDILVSSGKMGPTYIYRFDISGRKDKLSIPVCNYIYGMTVKGRDVIYCGDDSGLHMINLDSKATFTIRKDGMSLDTYITSYNDNIYFTDYNNNTVTCCDFQGTMKWMFQDNDLLKEPRGISVDSSGHVYVAGCLSNNIIVMSPDDKTTRQILGINDGLCEPRAICIDKSTNKLLVTMKDRKVLLYQIIHNM